MNESMREFSQKMESAKEAVGEALIPVANTLANFIDNIPKELLEAGVWAGIGVAMATALGGAVIGIKALVDGRRVAGPRRHHQRSRDRGCGHDCGYREQGSDRGKTTGWAGWPERWGQ